MRLCLGFRYSGHLSLEFTQRKRASHGRAYNTQTYDALLNTHCLLKKAPESLPEPFHITHELGIAGKGHTRGGIT
ncbi:hypothetical protein DSLASN_48850 [Desulfoluna limicola]|uniref:Uncharacterized protein n=1 Tax=Desulfoluna limicola TaxID=2810562 RepID=A0ABM7PPW9_9BACT|nr:hypothetical protein DSLASN_48850 [Desulfoluna limicola]